MPEFISLKLQPISPFHLGERGIGLEEISDILHSDTLFGALAWAWEMLHGKDELDALLQLFINNNPPFIISSGYPFAENVYFFPTPLSPHYRETNKKLRKTRFVSQRIFERIINEELIEDSPGLYKGNAYIDASEAHSLESLKSVLWAKKEPPQVALDRETSSSEIYHVGEVAFSKDCGLYFLVDLRDETFGNKLEAAVRLLGDEGIGGERSSGRGRFTLQRGSLRIRTPESKTSVTLSLYHPRKDEVAAGLMGRSYYTLTARRGWIFSFATRSLRKKTIRMMEEGSVIPAGDLRGSLVDVTPKEMKAHRVYANGLAFQVPMRVST